MRSATCERTSRFTIRSGFIKRWTIKRQRRSIRADKTSFLEWVCFVLFSTKNCLDFWDHHTSLVSSNATLLKMLFFSLINNIRCPRQIYQGSVLTRFLQLISPLNNLIMAHFSLALRICWWYDIASKFLEGLRHYFKVWMVYVLCGSDFSNRRSYFSYCVLQYL